MGIKSLVKQVLTEKENKTYDRLLADRKMTYGEWLEEQEKLWAEERKLWSRDGESSGKVSENRSVLSEADAENGEFVLILAADGETASYAERNIRSFFLKNPEVMVLYGDEDVLTTAGECMAPWFKPDWSPDFLDSCLYFGSLVAVRRQRWQIMRESYELIYPGHWQQLFGEENPERVYRVKDLTAYEKWLHDCVSAGYERSISVVGHIPQILFHARKEEQVRFLEESDYLRARRRELCISFFQNFVDSENAQKPAVSVVIPSKDQPDILRQCVESVKKAGADIPLEMIIVDNGSEPENKARIEVMLGDEASVGMDGREFQIRYLYEPMEFNFSRMCNLGAEASKGELLLFLNDDVVLEDGCIAEMAARAARIYTGAVGVKLLYPDTGRIQHAGITNLPMGPVHKLQSMPDDRDYYGRTNRCCRNFLAVTAACLMVEKEKFAEAGGFSEELRVAFNDVDFCFRLHELGYYNVCVNDIYAYHYESLSRGDDESAEKLKRLIGERRKLYERHPELEGRDPYYSDYLNRDGLDVRISPAFLTARNRPQSVTGIRPLGGLAGYREDKCLLVRVEDVRDGEIVGWSVVSGDNNACYERKFLLRNISETKTCSKTDCQLPLGKRSGTEPSVTVYGVALQGQYRPDLEENMTDQTNVGLSGFWLELLGEEIPTGSYQIGVAARNRVTGLKLINWSNRTVEF